MTTSIACPYCHTDSRILPVYSGGAQTNLGYSLYHCGGCDLPFITILEMVPKVTVHKIEGIEPAGKTPEIPTMEELIQKDIDENTYTCFRCGEKFTTDADVEPDRKAGEIYCSACFDHVDPPCPSGTQPDPDQFLCTHCGTLHPTTEGTLSADGGKICKSCFEEELAETAIHVNKTELEYILLPESKTVSYYIDADGVNLKYKGSFSGRYTHDLLWTIIDSPKEDWSGEIHNITKNETNHVAKKSALNQFCKAVADGIVKIPGSDE